MKVEVMKYLTPDERRQFHGQRKNTRRSGRVSVKKSFKAIFNAILSRNNSNIQ